MLRRYREVIALDDASRLTLAQRLSAPELAADFADSVRAMGNEYRHTGPFRPQPRYPRPPRQSTLENGADLAWQVHRQGTLHVDDDESLTVDYVDYEVS